MATNEQEQGSKSEELIFDIDDPIYSGSQGRQVHGPSGDMHVFNRDDVMIGEDGAYYVLSRFPPEEVLCRGLHLGPDSRILRKNQIRFVTPSERSISESRDDGLCIYCQLLLLPDPPKYAAHQPNFQKLMASRDRCTLCKVISSSLSQGSNDLEERYNSGDPALWDQDDKTSAITVKSEAHDRYFRILAACGDRQTSGNHGKPVVWTTRARLGDIAHRRIWSDYYDPNRGPAVTRLNIMKEWLLDCSQNHPYCDGDFESEPPLLPTRVLQVSQGDKLDPVKVKIHVSAGEHGDYIALSHKWGSLVPVKTLRSNIAGFEQRIPFRDLPLTFQDAVFFASYIGVQYVWIDSLCIIQDDEQEWQREAATMAAVYSNALLTFAASAANDASEGCQFQCDGPLCLPSGNDTALIRFEDHQNLDGPDQPLNQRGWCFQEAALSRRMICFTSDQMLWKCNSKHESEDGLLNVESSSISKWDGLWNIWANVRQTQDNKSKYDYWYSMMQDYSCRSIRYQKDKLAALAGITESFGTAINDSSALGLWLGDFQQGILWRTSKFEARVDEALKVPSWSWISVDGPVSWMSYESSERSIQLEVCNVQIDWSGPAMTSPLLTATAQVRGRLKEAKLWKTGFHESTFHLREINESAQDIEALVEALSISDVEELPTDIFGYCELDEPRQVDSHVWVLEVSCLSRKLEASDERDEVSQVLILLPTEADARFTRIGVGIVWIGSTVKYGTTDVTWAFTFEGVEKSVITIV